MKARLHPHNASLAPLLGLTQVVEESLAANGRVYLLTSNHLKLWQLGGLLHLGQRVRQVGSLSTLLSLASGVVKAGGVPLVLAPVETLQGELVPGAVVIGVSDGISQSIPGGVCRVSGDYLLAPADVHQAASALRWALGKMREMESVYIQVSARPVPLVWAAHTEYSPDRWLPLGQGDSAMFAIGSALPVARAAMEALKSKNRGVRVVPITELRGDAASRRAVRRLATGAKRLVIVRPPAVGEWVEEALETVGKTKVVLLNTDSQQRLQYSDGALAKTLERYLSNESAE